MRKRSIATLLVAVFAVIVTGGVVAYYLVDNLPETYIAILSDTHIVAESYFTSKELYEYYSEQDKMVHLSEAVVKSVADDIIKDKRIKTVFIPGDMTDYGDLASHKAAAKIFQKIADAGKQVFVINGNHDAHDNSTFGERGDCNSFREIYANFGYKQALVKDSASLSYTADINNKYRLIAIDNDNYFNTDTGSYKEEIDERLIAWCSGQIEQCRKDNKEPIVMAHKPFLNHFPPIVEGIIRGDSPNGGAAYNAFVDMLAENEVHYTITGHNHIQSITRADSDGFNFYDINTCSPIYFPCAYRTLKVVKDSMYLDIVYINKINPSYVHPFSSQEEKTKAATDFHALAKEHSEKGALLTRSLSGRYLNKVLKLEGELAEIVGLLGDEALLALLFMPMYEKDAQGEISLQQIAKNHGSNIPTSEYTNLNQLLNTFVISINNGDRNINSESIEIALLNNALYAVFYMINELSGELAAIVPDAPVINLDIDRLYRDNELELFDSNFLAFIFAVAGDKIPVSLDVSKLEDLNSIRVLIKPLLNMLIPKLGNATAGTIGEKELHLKSFLDDALYSLLLVDFLKSENNNKVVINKTTWEVKGY